MLNYTLFIFRLYKFCLMILKIETIYKYKINIIIQATFLHHTFFNSLLVYIL